MDDDRGRDALALAEAALALAMRDGVTEAEALVTSEDSALTRFANSEIHQNVAETNTAINLRVVVGKRVGVGATGRGDADALADHDAQVDRRVRLGDVLVDLAVGEPGQRRILAGDEGLRLG